MIKKNIRSIGVILVLIICIGFSIHALAADLAETQGTQLLSDDDGSKVENTEYDQKLNSTLDACKIPPQPQTESTSKWLNSDNDPR